MRNTHSNISIKNAILDDGKDIFAIVADELSKSAVIGRYLLFLR